MVEYLCFILLLFKDRHPEIHTHYKRICVC